MSQLWRIGFWVSFSDWLLVVVEWRRACERAFVFFMSPYYLVSDSEGVCIRRLAWRR